MGSISLTQYTVRTKLTPNNFFPYIIIGTIYFGKISQFMEMQKEQYLISLGAFIAVLGSIIHAFILQA